MERFKYLFNRYVSKTATALERSEFQSLLQTKEHDQQLKGLIDEYFLSYGPNQAAPEFPGAREVLKTVLASDGAGLQKPIVKKLWPRPVPNWIRRIAVAAAAVAAIAFGTWFYNTAHKTTGSSLIYANDILPGSNKATLTLASGKVINLNTAKTGLVVGNDKLTYNDGSLVNPSSAGANETLTLKTPHGGTYNVTLSDGTKVWLNSASGLTYMANLGKSGIRRVKLEGEAYFEVAKNKTRPFLVESRGQTVEVLGTHFNINSYTDESSVKTTLLEGSVKVNNVVLKPNQQAALTADHKIQVAPIDAETVIAWKNGNFLFAGEHIEPIMRRLALWYNIEVVYQGQKPAGQFRGVISRHNKISEVLKMMELTGAVHFKIEGRKVYVKE